MYECIWIVCSAWETSSWVVFASGGKTIFSLRLSLGRVELRLKHIIIFSPNHYLWDVGFRKHDFNPVFSALNSFLWTCLTCSAFFQEKEDKDYAVFVHIDEVSDSHSMILPFMTHMSHCIVFCTEWHRSLRPEFSTCFSKPSAVIELKCSLAN